MVFTSSFRGAYGPQSRRRNPSARPGTTPETAVLSGVDLINKWSNLDPDIYGPITVTPPSDYYWIKSAAMPNALQMYVDTVEESGGYDFYAFNGNGTPTSFANATNSGTALGLDLVYPRSKFHWRAMSNFVRNVLGQTGANYGRWFQTTYGVHKTTAGGNFTTTIMRNATSYGTGSTSHRVNDNGRWWLRDTVYTEPNGDYPAYGLFGGGTVIPEPYALQDLTFNDINASYSTGAYYLVSTNAKP